VDRGARRHDENVPSKLLFNVQHDPPWRKNVHDGVHCTVSSTVRATVGAIAAYVDLEQQNVAREGGWIRFRDKTSVTDGLVD
jgi:hypothetical protein